MTREPQATTLLLPAAELPRRTAVGVVRAVHADEAPLLHLAVRSVLSAMGGYSLAGAATSVARAEQLILRIQPDLLITDVDVASDSGIALCRWAQQACPGIVTIILAGRSEPLIVQSAFAAGVSGYLLKGSSQESLTRCLHQVMAGARVLDDQIGQPQRGRAGDELASQAGLSPREREVLEEMLGGFGNKTIARRLCISEDTVKSHVKAIFRKLGARDRAHAVALALGSASPAEGPGATRPAGSRLPWYRVRGPGSGDGRGDPRTSRGTSPRHPGPHAPQSVAAGRRRPAIPPAPVSPGSRAAGVVVGLGLLGLAIAAGRDTIRIRAFEAWLAGHVIAAGARVPTSAAPRFATVFFAVRSLHIGLVITPECTIALLTIPFLAATALIIWARGRILWPVTGLAAALGLLVLVNQVRLLGIVWFVKEMGFSSGFYWGHTLVGSMITIVGLATSLATFAYLAVGRGRAVTQ